MAKHNGMAAIKISFHESLNVNKEVHKRTVSQH